MLVHKIQITMWLCLLDHASDVYWYKTEKWKEDQQSLKEEKLERANVWPFCLKYDSVC